MDQKILKEYLTYRDDGTFIAKKSRGSLRVGQPVCGHSDNAGYKIVSFGNVNRKYHRLIFLYHHGFLPKFIDHINRDKADNRIENLRAATSAQNRANIPSGRKGKLRGVSFVKRINSFISHIGHDGRLIHLGYFKSEEAAGRAYDKKAKELFGDFAILNFT